MDTGGPHSIYQVGAGVDFELLINSLTQLVPSLHWARVFSCYALEEHTLASYRLALEMDADFIEPDLVASKDGILVAVHSADLNVTTNVHAFNNGEFQSRARTSEANKGAWGYYVNDFTWDELQKLHVKQRVKEGGARFEGYDGLFKIPSFTQIVDMLHDWNSRELPLIGRPGKVGGVSVPNYAL